MIACNLWKVPATMVDKRDIFGHDLKENKLPHMFRTALHNVNGLTESKNMTKSKEMIAQTFK